MSWVPAEGSDIIAIDPCLMEDGRATLTIGESYTVIDTGTGELGIIDDNTTTHYFDTAWSTCFKPTRKEVPSPSQKFDTNDAGELLQSTEETLIERGNRYGEYHKVAEVSQQIKEIFFTGMFNSGKNPDETPSYVKESLEMIANKLSRIVNGDPLYDDNWRDIAGYAQLIVDELNKTK